MTAIGSSALDQLFREARTFSYWQDRPVEDSLLQQAWACISGESLRVLFLRDPAEKEKLVTTNMRKVMTAPVTALLAAADDLSEACVQGGELLIALRAMGLDCGPIGFERDAADAAFFSTTGWRSILLINIGYGDRSKLHPRGPRFAFHEVCAIL